MSDPFTDDVLAAAVADWLAQASGLQDGKLYPRGSYVKEITQCVFEAVYGSGNEAHWPSGWEQTWDTIEGILTDKRIKITVSFEDDTHDTP